MAEKKTTRTPKIQKNAKAPSKAAQKPSPEDEQKAEGAPGLPAGKQASRAGKKRAPAKAQQKKEQIEATVKKEGKSSASTEKPKGAEKKSAVRKETKTLKAKPADDSTPTRSRPAQKKKTPAQLKATQTTTNAEPATQESKPAQPVSTPEPTQEKKVAEKKTALARRRKQPAETKTSAATATDTAAQASAPKTVAEKSAKQPSPDRTAETNQKKPEQSDSKPDVIEVNGRKVPATFSLIGLHEGVQNSLKLAKYFKPTEVQALCLPYTIEGVDLAGFAQTGTGKTAVFLITAAHRILEESLKPAGQGGCPVLVLVPTRELADQIQNEAKTIFQGLKLTTLAVYGGTADIDKQARALSQKVDILVATPGRLFDLHRQGHLQFDDVGLFICDEADRMLDMGFIEDVERVLQLIPEKSQKLLFSATGSEKVRELAFEFLNDPEYVETTPEQISPEKITQWCYATRAVEKFPVLLSSLKKENPTCAIVFTNTKVVAEWVGYKLAANGINAEVLTGDLPQNRRMSLIKAIKDGNVKVLVATDVLSRGLHVTGLSHVYNFDVPDDAESFIHRIGRTARAGEKGNAITLICEDYGFNMGAVQDLLGFEVPLRPIPPEFLTIQDKSDFPFDAFGRVKTVRSLREEPVEDLKPQAPQDRGARGQHRPARGQQISAESPAPTRSSHSRPEATAQPTPELVENRRPQDDSRTRANVSDRQERPYASSRPEERRTRTPLQETSASSRPTRAESAPTAKRESKFVRRDERAREVIEAALLAAARERELQRGAQLKTPGKNQDAPKIAGVIDPDLAKNTAKMIGDGIVRSLRKAAPGLGSFLRKLGSLLDEEENSRESHAQPPQREETNAPTRPETPRRHREHERKQQRHQDPAPEDRVTFEHEPSAPEHEAETASEVVFQHDGRPLRPETRERTPEQDRPRYRGNRRGRHPESRGHRPRSPRHD